MKLSIFYSGKKVSENIIEFDAKPKRKGIIFYWSVSYCGFGLCIEKKDRVDFIGIFGCLLFDGENVILKPKSNRPVFYNFNLMRFFQPSTMQA